MFSTADFSCEWWLGLLWLFYFTFFLVSALTKTQTTLCWITEWWSSLHRYLKQTLICTKNTGKIIGTLNPSQHQQVMIGNQLHFSTTSTVGPRKIVWVVITLGKPTRHYLESQLAIRNILTTPVGEKPLHPRPLGWPGNWLVTWGRFGHNKACSSVDQFKRKTNKRH